MSLPRSHDLLGSAIDNHLHLTERTCKALSEVFTEWRSNEQERLSQLAENALFDVNAHASACVAYGRVEMLNNIIDVLKSRSG